MRRLQMRNERHFVAVEESLATVATDAAEESLATVATAEEESFATVATAAVEESLATVAAAEAKEPLATVATPRPGGRKCWLARGAPCGVLQAAASCTYIHSYHRCAALGYPSTSLWPPTLGHRHRGGKIFGQTDSPNGVEIKRKVASPLPSSLSSLSSFLSSVMSLSLSSTLISSLHRHCHGSILRDTTKSQLSLILRSARLGSNGLGSSTIITFFHYLAFLQSSV